LQHETAHERDSSFTGAMTISITTFRIITHSLITLSPNGLFMTLSIYDTYMTYMTTVSIKDKENNNTVIMLSVEFYLLLCRVSLS
jgi:hypothetical protein